jgi:hypothetical protein
LRESAKVSLMKVALLLDRNPELYCWIDGHTDLFGGDEFNVELSRKRAEAVREYLVGTLNFAAARIIVRGRGKSEPLVKAGDVEQQALNRRVEIKMRKQPPEDDTPLLVKPRRRPPEADAVAPPRAVPAPEPVVAPRPVPRAVPVDEVPRALPVEPDPAPRALPVDPEAAPRALPVEDEPVLRAQPVEESPARAEPVDEEEP